MKHLPLFAKFFIAFWLITISMFLVGGLVMHELLEDHVVPVSKQEYRQLERLAITLQRKGKLPRSHLSDHLYILNKKGQDLRGRRIPRPLRRFIAEMEDKEEPYAANYRRHHIVGPYQAQVGRQQLQLYAMLPQRFPYGGPSEYWPGNLIIALLISALLCYWLSRFMTRPIRAIQKGSHELAQGQLSSRIDRHTSQRNDEIGELARDFNQMAEQLEELLGAQKRLLQDISHELRSPLTRLQLALAIARKKSGGQAEKEHDRIELERERLDGLIQQILTLSRLENMGPPEMQQLDLVLLLKDTLQQGRLEAEQRQVELSYQGPEDAFYQGNPQLLFSVVDNLLRNAIRHSPEQGQIELQLQDQGSNWLITLSDEGGGVPEDLLPQLFERFYRVDEARNQDTGGAGLGLAIAKSAVLQHKGQITATNNDKGLAVSITLPK